MISATNYEQGIQSTAAVEPFAVNDSICDQFSEHWNNGEIKLQNVLVFYNTILVFAIMFSNIFLLYGLKRTGQILKRSNLIVVSLCVIDLSVGIFVQPLHLYRIYKDSCLLSKISNGLAVFFTNNSVLSVYFLAAVRYYSIRGGLNGKKVSRRTIMMLIALSWLLSVIAAVLHFFFISKLAYYGFITAAYVVCTILFIYCYASVLYLTHQSNKAVAKSNNTVGRQNVLRMAKTVVALFTAMFICYTPMIVIGDYRAVMIGRNVSHDHETLLATVHHWSLSLVCTNSAFNACVVLYRNDKVWKLFKETFLF